MENINMICYRFLKDFSEVAEAELARTGEMPECEITVFGPVKVRKGTKNAPSPFYDREMETDDDNKRFTVYQLKRYKFKFGDKYVPEVTEEEGAEKVEKAPTREKPDESCRMLYRNIKSGKLTIDVVNPEKVGETTYFLRTNDPEKGKVFIEIERETPLMESVNEWKPSYSGEFKPVTYQQFSLESVIYLKYKNDGDELFVNLNVDPEVVRDLDKYLSEDIH